MSSAAVASEDLDIELTADDDVLDAARTLGAMRNVHSAASKASALDRPGAGASYDDRDRFKAYTSTTTSVSAPPSSLASSTLSTASSTSTSTSTEVEADPALSAPTEDNDNPHLLARMSAMPILGTAMRAYSHGKASSRVVKYGAEMVEGTVRSVTRPVIDRLPVTSEQLGQLDDFACRTLDRFGGTPSASSPSSASASSPGSGTLKGANAASPSDSARASSRGRGRKHLWISDDDDDSSSSAVRSPPSTRRRIQKTQKSRSPSRDSISTSTSTTAASSSLAPASSETAYSGTSQQIRYESDAQWRSAVQSQGPYAQNAVASSSTSGAVASTAPTTSTASTGQEIQVVSRSKWQAVLLEAGGIGAAVSEESMKRLKYCLQWLQYANHHIDQQILLLRSFIQSVTPSPSPSTSTATNGTSTALIPYTSLSLLTQIKRELINTIRQVVDVVSTYAGGALPEQARASVRGFILMLPERWSSAAAAPFSFGDERGGVNGGEGRGEGVSAQAALAASTRVLTLAMESLDMMRGITGVFKESLDRAEAWVDRLQQLGLQRQQQQQRQTILPGHHPDFPSFPLSAYATSSSPASSFPSSSYRTTQYDDKDRERERERDGAATPHLAPSDSASLVSPSPAPSTRAASDGGDDTETEMDDGMDEDGSDGESVGAGAGAGKKGLRRRNAREGEMDVDA